MIEVWCGPVKEKEDKVRLSPQNFWKRFIWGLAMVGDVTESRE